MAKKALASKKITVDEEKQFIPLTSDSFKKNYDENL